MNQIVLDLDTKDIIRITNGTERDGIFEPTEGIVLRVTGSTKGVQIAYSYRKVNPSTISPMLHGETETRAFFDYVCSSKNFQKVPFIGRI